MSKKTNNVNNNIDMELYEQIKRENIYVKVNNKIEVYRRELFQHISSGKDFEDFHIIEIACDRRKQQNMNSIRGILPTGKYMPSDFKKVIIFYTIEMKA